jgi:hypothetical protein
VPSPAPGQTVPCLPPCTPPPPESPTLRNVDSRLTTRLYGEDPFSEAVAVTQHEYPGARPPNAPGETNQVADRPWGILLVTPDDPLVGISAVPLVHFPDDAPVLFVTADGIPQVTYDEINRLQDTGIVRMNNTDVIAIGAAANQNVINQLATLNIAGSPPVVLTVTGTDVFDIANKVDILYGSVQNPDTGVPQMGGSASEGGNGIMDMFVCSADGDAWQYCLPATHFSSHMPVAIQWVHQNSIPQATVEAMQRRMGRGFFYVMGGSDVISADVVKQINQYGATQRITDDDPIAFNTPATNTPVRAAIGFAKMWDPAGMIGWDITGPGHGLTLVNINDWQGAVGSAILSHLGFHAPLLLNDSSTDLNGDVQAFLSTIAPTYKTTPANGPYNMIYVMGDYNDIAWPVQAQCDFVSEMSNARVYLNPNNGRYQPEPSG